MSESSAEAHIPSGNKHEKPVETHESGGSVAPGERSPKKRPRPEDSAAAVPRTERRPTTINTENDQREGADALLRLEQVMRQPDAILEPGILQIVREYITKGGKPQMVLELLSDNYTGLAQMAGLTTGWLDLVARDAGAAAAAGGPLPAEITSSAEARSEASFLRALVSARFDPERVGISEFLPPPVTAEAPSWATGLLQSPESRQLVFRLAGQYPGTLFLEYLVLLGVQMGHWEEVAAVPAPHPSLSLGLPDRLTSFHSRLFCAVGDAISCHTEDVPRVMKQLWELSSASEAHYLIVQQILDDLSWDPLTGRVLSGRLRRLSQDLELQAAAARGGVAHELSFTLQHAAMSHKRLGGTRGRGAERARQLQGAVMDLVANSDPGAKRRGLRDLHAAFCGDPGAAGGPAEGAPGAAAAAAAGRAGGGAPAKASTSLAAALASAADRAALSGIHAELSKILGGGGNRSLGQDGAGPGPGSLALAMNGQADGKAVVAGLGLGPYAPERRLQHVSSQERLSSQGAASPGPQAGLLDVEETSLRPQPLSRNGLTPIVSPIRPISRLARARDDRPTVEEDTGESLQVTLRMPDRPPTVPPGGPHPALSPAHRAPGSSPFISSLGRRPMGPAAAATGAGGAIAAQPEPPSASGRSSHPPVQSSKPQGTGPPAKPGAAARPDPAAKPRPATGGPGPPRLPPVMAHCVSPIPALAFLSERHDRKPGPQSAPAAAAQPRPPAPAAAAAAAAAVPVPPQAPLPAQPPHPPAAPNGSLPLLDASTDLASPKSALADPNAPPRTFPPPAAPAPAPAEPPLPPPLDVLRHPRVLEALTRIAFYRPLSISKGLAFQEDEREAAADLLALASAGTSGLDPDATGSVTETRQHLSAVLALCRACAAARGQDPLADVFSGPVGELGLQALRQSPAAAASAIQYARAWLLDQETHRLPNGAHVACCMLHALRVAVEHHSAVRASIVHLCESALRALGPGSPALARRFVDLLVTCALLGYVEATCGAMEAMATDGAADAQLVRYFVVQLLAHVEPPYSPYFASSAVRIALLGFPDRPEDPLERSLLGSLYEAAAASAAAAAAAAAPGAALSPGASSPVGAGPATGTAPSAHGLVHVESLKAGLEQLESVLRPEGSAGNPGAMGGAGIEGGGMWGGEAGVFMNGAPRLHPLNLSPLGQQLRAGLGQGAGRTDRGAAGTESDRDSRERHAGGGGVSGSDHEGPGQGTHTQHTAAGGSEVEGEVTVAMMG